MPDKQTCYEDILNVNVPTRLPEEILLSAAVRQSRDRSVVVTYANHAYLPVVLNWLIALDRVGVGSVLVVTLDQHTHDFLHQRGFPAVLVDTGKTLKDIRITRVRVSHPFEQTRPDLATPDKGRLAKTLHQVQGVSYPRSGHHMLVELLKAYFHATECQGQPYTSRLRKVLRHFGHAPIVAAIPPRQHFLRRRLDTHDVSKIIRITRPIRAALNMPELPTIHPQCPDRGRP